MICVDFLCVWIGHLKCYSLRRSWKLKAKESAMASHFGSRPRERFKCSAGKSGGAKNLGSSVEARTLREGKGPGGAECRNEWQLQRIRMAFHWVDRFTVVVGGGPANVGLHTKENMAACCSPPWQVTTICSSGCRRMLASRCIQNQVALRNVVVLYSSAPRTWLALLDTDTLAALTALPPISRCSTSAADQWPCQSRRQQLMTGRLPADDLMVDSHWAPWC